MSANTIGRANVLALTNKSGGAVAAGDVVVIDTANNDAFTTTTSANFTGALGVVLSTSIASNAVGLVVLNGYVSLVNVNASVTRGHYGATFTVAKQATDAGASRVAGTFCQFLTGGTTPDAMVWQPDFGAGGTTVTTKGDLQTYSTVPASLGVGADGTVLTADSTQTTGLKWASGGSGLVLLEQHTANNTATSLDFTSFISSTYDEYLFEIIDLLPATNATMLYMHVRSGGSFITSAKYTTGGFAWIANATAVFGNVIGTLAGQITTANAADCYNVAGYGMNGWVRLYSPGSSAAVKRVLFDLGWHENAGANVKGSTGRAAYVDTATIDGFQFIYSSGNIASGTIRAYGIAK